MTAKPVLNRAQFHTSVAQLRDLPYSRAEIAFAGDPMPENRVQSIFDA